MARASASKSCGWAHAPSGSGCIALALSAGLPHVQRRSPYGQARGTAIHLASVIMEGGADTGERVVDEAWQRSASQLTCGCCRRRARPGAGRGPGYRGKHAVATAEGASRRCPRLPRTPRAEPAVRRRPPTDKRREPLVSSSTNLGRVCADSGERLWYGERLWCGFFDKLSQKGFFGW